MTKGERILNNIWKGSLITAFSSVAVLVLVVCLQFTDFSTVNICPDCGTKTTIKYCRECQMDTVSIRQVEYCEECEGYFLEDSCPGCNVEK